MDDDLRAQLIDTPIAGTAVPRETTPDIAVNMFLMRAKQAVFLDRSIVDRPIVASNATIDSDFELHGTHLASLIASGIQIRGALLLGFNDKALNYPRGGQGPMTKWFDGAELNLKYASINAIVAPEDEAVWPQKGKLHLTNFHLVTFTPGYCKSNKRFPVEASAECVHRPGWYKAWLGLDSSTEEKGSAIR